MKVFGGQINHFLFLAISLWLMRFVSNNFPSLLDGELWNVSSKTWLIIAIASPIVHQIYVLICWRLELYFQSISNTFGKNGFLFYKIGFAVLIISRPVTITFLAVSNANTLDINPIIGYIVSFILFIPAIYLFYSVKKYFGMDRAFGIDHFEPEKAKTFPMVTKGIFKYTANGMYVFGFLIFWAIGFFFLSKATLFVALFSHTYIWIHFYYTEKPDMDFIFGNKMKEMGKVLAVSKSLGHTLIKKNESLINLKQGLGVEGDAHFGKKIKHVFDAKRNPNKPNLRQVHLIHSELHKELSYDGYTINPGEMGENITTTGIDLLSLPLDTVLSIGKVVKIKITGTRKPCNQLNQIQDGLMNSVVDNDTEGNIIFKAGVFAVVLQGGIIQINDKIVISLPNKPFRNLMPV